MEAATLAQRADGVGEGMVHLIFFFGEFGLLQPGTVRVRLFFPKQRSIGVLNLCKERDSVTRLTGD